LYVYPLESAMVFYVFGKAAELMVTGRDCVLIDGQSGYLQPD
jgi:hypothetical protein